MTDMADVEVPDYQVELIETELLRAGSEGLGKEELQQVVGLGVTDLRNALEAALTQGVAVAAKDGYVAGPAAGATGGDPDPLAEAADAVAAGDPDEEEEELAPEELMEGAQPEGPSYRTRIVLDVSYRLEGEDAAGGDDAAVRDANAIARVAREGVVDQWADLAVSAAVAYVDAFESPRRVFP